LCKVLRVDGHKVYADIIPPEFGLEASKYKTGKYCIKADKIIFSAGAIHSTTLLMKSFGAEFLPAIGRYFTCHPALILVGQHANQINANGGHPKSFYCDEFHHTNKFLLETCYYFPFTLAKNLAGFGAEVDELLHLYKNLQMILVLAIDAAEAHNRVKLGANGKPMVDYTFNAKTISSFVAAIQASTKIFFAAGAKKVHAPSMTKFFITPDEAPYIDQLITKNNFKLGKISVAAAHLMGGCRMGSDKTTSVTNEWGKIHGFEDYYVADASLFPKASEVNPYLTIMSLANRVAEGIKRDLGEDV
ncbi:hypothetical protein BVY03_00260, partial [bacterium K02(2017)]